MPPNDFDVVVGIVSDFELVEAIAVPVVALSDIPVVEVIVNVVVVSEVIGGIEPEFRHQ